MQAFTSLIHHKNYKFLPFLPRFAAAFSIMPPKRKDEPSTSKPAKKQRTLESSFSAKKSKKSEDSDSSSDEESKDVKPTSPKKRSSGLNIISWNVNGVKAWLKGKGLDYIRKHDPDIFCIQETKSSDADKPKEMEVPGYYCYWCFGEKKGYSGTALFSKEKPVSIKNGIGIVEHDNEGRTITAEYKDFYLICAYVPNSGRGLPRLGYRQGWDKDFRNYMKDLDKKKPVILTGDLNVAHKEIDLANPKTNKKTAGFTAEERQGFTDLLDEGFVDSFRHFYPEKTGAYSFWTYMGGARAKNVGWRLDYFVVSERFMSKVSDSLIHSEVMGSDHCPISLKIK